VEDDAAAVVAVDPEDGPRDLAPARADQPRERDDLAAADVERHVDEHALAGEALDLEDHVADVLLLRDVLRELAADHRADEVVRREPGQLAREDEAAVAKDRDALADAEDLLEPVRDEQQRRAAGAKRLDDAEQPLDLHR